MSTVAAIAHVLALHSKDPTPYPTGYVCDHCEYRWPCPTVKTINEYIKEQQ